MAISDTFCLAKANQFLISGLSLISLSKSTGVCNSEQLPAIHKLSPNLAIKCSRVSRLLLKLFFQILRPFTIPTDRILVLGHSLAIVTNCFGAEQTSTCKPCTGKVLTSSKLLPKSPKYVVNITLIELNFNCAYAV